MWMNSYDIDYKIVRTGRKTVALHIRDGVLEVRAPHRATIFLIEDIIREKKSWIVDKLASSKEKSERRSAFTVNYGDTVEFLGKPFPVKAVDGNRFGFNGEYFYMPPGLPPEHIKQICIRIYRMLAKEDLIPRTFGLSRRMCSFPYSVRVSGARTRWGSCSAQKNINFSWRLMMAEEELIDYVVVHELAHLKEMNHSDRFWKIVEGVMPDWHDRRMRLKELHRRLSVQDWQER